MKEDLQRVQKDLVPSILRQEVKYHNHLEKSQTKCAENGMGTWLYIVFVKPLGSFLGEEGMIQAIQVSRKDWGTWRTHKPVHSIENQRSKPAKTSKMTRFNVSV